MQDIRTSTTAPLINQLQTSILSLTMQPSPQIFIKQLQRSFQPCINSSNCLIRQYLLELIQNFFASPGSQQQESDFVDNTQTLWVIRTDINQKLGQFYGQLFELFIRIVEIKLSFGDDNQANKLSLDNCITSMSRNLQKLRFLLQIQNFRRIGQGINYIQFHDLIIDVIDCWIGKDASQKAVNVIHSSMSQEISNIDDDLLEKVLKINKTTKLQDPNPPSCQFFTNQKDLVLKYIKKRSKQFQSNKNQTQQSRMIDQKFQNSVIYEPSYLKKFKIIEKQRTIYHQRRNMFVPKKKKSGFDYSQKCDSLDYSTQWSSTFQKQKMRRTIKDFNQDFDDNILVAKTPKPQKALFFSKPISFRLDFSQ